MRRVPSSVAVAGAAMVSRVFGYARDVLVANILGAGPVAEAFLAALRAPNALRRIVGEGGFNGAVIPLYMRLRQRHGSETAANFGRDFLALATLLLALASAALAFAASAVIALSAPGLDATSPDFALARWCFLWMTPFMATTALAHVAGAFLNAERRFFSAALAPAVVNLALVAAYPAIGAFDLPSRDKALLMAAALSVGGALQLLLTVLPLAPLLSLARNWFGAAARAEVMRAMRLLGPVLLATASVQIIGLVASAIASFDGGALVWFYYADRLFQLPLSLGGVVIGSVVLTDMSERRHLLSQVAASVDVQRALNDAVSLSFAWGIPAGIGLAVLSLPIVATLFGHGAFHQADVEATAMMLATMAVALPAALAARVLTQDMLVREASWLAASSGWLAVLATLIACVIFQQMAGPLGVAIGLAIGLWTLFAITAALMLRRRWWTPTAQLGGQIARQVAAGAAMALVVGLMHPVLEALFGGGAHWGRAAALALSCITGAAVYGSLVLLVAAMPKRNQSS